jgi:hypothetical protein
VRLVPAHRGLLFLEGQAQRDVVEGGAGAGLGVVVRCRSVRAEALVEEGEHGGMAAEPLGDAEEDDVGEAFPGRRSSPMMSS